MAKNIVIFVLAALVLWLGINSFVSRLKISFAREQIEVFHDMAEQARNEPSMAARYAEYVAAYYPSGTKQTTGSDLDYIVERARQDCLARLRAKR